MKTCKTWFLEGSNRYGDIPVFRAEFSVKNFSKKEAIDFLKKNKIKFSDLKLSKNKKEFSFWEIAIKAVFFLLELDVVFYKEHLSIKKGYVYAVFNANSGKFGEAVFRVVKNLPRYKYKIKDRNIENILAIKSKKDLKPIAKRFSIEAKKRNIPFTLLNRTPVIAQLGYGSKLERTWSALTSRTLRIGARLTVDKHLTNKLLRRIDIPVPDSKLVKSEKKLKDLLEGLSKPVVIKPADSTVGQGVSMNISNLRQAKKAYRSALKFSEKVIVENQVMGHYYRVVFVDGEMIACAKSFPVKIKGDGKNRLVDLIKVENKKQYRQDHNKNGAFYKIELNEKIRTIIQSQGYKPTSVIPKDQEISLSFSGADGGEWIEDNKSVCSENMELLQRAMKFIGLNVAGVDILSPDIAVPLTENGGVLLEINAGPDVNIHANVNRGKKIVIEKYILNSLFKKGEDGRIPIISVTGTNGKTTTTKLIAHILDSLENKTIGLTTSAGKFIDKTEVRKGDMSGFLSARSLLINPQIDIAVLETCHILGIDRRGLGYDWSDGGVITNLTEDHLETYCTKTMQDLFQIKSVVARRVKKGGFLVLNADDAQVVKMATHIVATVVYISTNKNNDLIVGNIQKGLPVFYLDKGFLVENIGGQEKKIINVNKIPITFKGQADFNVYNSLSALAISRTVFREQLSLKKIKEKLESFGEKMNDNPGRFNIIKKKNFQVIVDYAHNPDGYRKAIALAQKNKKRKLIGVIKSAGDRGEKFTQELGLIAGENFDWIIIKAPITEKLRGSTQKIICERLKKGVISTGFPKEKIEIIYDEKKASKRALDLAGKNDTVVIFAHNVSAVLEVVKKYEK